MSKLPPEVCLQIARVSVREVWEVEELMNVIKGEVEAREISDHVKVTERKQPDIRKYPAATASTLLVREGSGRIVCVYCKGDHFSAACESFCETKVRKEVLKKEGRCFLCLSQGHKAAQCTSKRKCRKCSSVIINQFVNRMVVHRTVTYHLRLITHPRMKHPLQVQQQPQT